MAAAQRSEVLRRSAGLLALENDAGLPQPVDLNKGYESYVRRDGNASVGLEPIVEALKAAHASFSGFNICTFRNNLNKIALTLLSPQDHWKINGCWAYDTLFLDITKTEQPHFPNADLMIFYGYKFEAVMTGSQTVDASSEFCSILRVRLGSHSIAMAAEIDACTAKHLESQQLPDISSYVELKTYTIPENRRKDISIKRFKHPRWWLQCFLAGVPNLILGGRDAQGILRRVDKVQVSQLCKISATCGCAWDPNKYLLFLEDILSWMQSKAVASAGQQLQFEYKGDERIIVCESIENGDLPGRLAYLLGKGLGPVV